MRSQMARRLRRLADRLDRHGAPKATGLTLRFHDGRGAVIEWHGEGCPLWYLGDEDYERAHTAAERPGGVVPR